MNIIKLAVLIVLSFGFSFGFSNFSIMADTNLIKQAGNAISEKDFTLASNLLLNALEVPSIAQEAGELLLQIYYDVEKPKQGLDLYEKLKTKYPFDQTLALNAGYLALQMKKMVLAKKLFNYAWMLAPGNVNIVIKIAEKCSENNAYELAIYYVNLIKPFLPADKKIEEITSKIYQNNNRYDDAKISSFYIQANEKKNVENTIDHAYILIELGSYPAAINLMKSVLKKDSKNIFVKYHLANMYFYSKRYKEALELFEKVLVEIGDTDRLVFMKSYLLGKINKTGEAINYIQERLFGEENNSKIKLTFANFLLGVDRSQEAVLIFNNLDLELTNSSSIAINYGWSLHRTRHYQEAVDVYEKYRSESLSSESTLLVNIGLAYAYLGRFSEAESLIGEVVSNDPSNFAYLYMACFHGLKNHSHELYKWLESAFISDSEYQFSIATDIYDEPAFFPYLQEKEFKSIVEKYSRNYR